MVKKYLWRVAGLGVLAIMVIDGFLESAADGRTALAAALMIVFLFTVIPAGYQRILEGRQLRTEEAQAQLQLRKAEKSAADAQRFVEEAKAPAPPARAVPPVPPARPAPPVPRARSVKSLQGASAPHKITFQMKLDEDGQPSIHVNAARREERDVSEMLGIVRGMLSDGVVTEAEVLAFAEWVQAHPEVVSAWPGSVVYDRLSAIFQDGIIEQSELEDLRELLSMLVGEGTGVVDGMQTSTSLPLDEPAPEVSFLGKRFVFTGKMVFGPRKACEEVVASLGGECGANVTKDTDFVVIGTFSSRDWKETTHGTKILKAVEYRDRGLPLAIVSEEHWVQCLPA